MSRGSRSLAGQWEPSPAKTETGLTHLSPFLLHHPLGMSRLIINSGVLSFEKLWLFKEAEFRCFPGKALPMDKSGFASSLLGGMEIPGLHHHLQASLGKANIPP